MVMKDVKVFPPSSPVKKGMRALVYRIKLDQFGCFSDRTVPVSNIIKAISLRSFGPKIKNTTKIAVEIPLNIGSIIKIVDVSTQDGVNIPTLEEIREKSKNGSLDMLMITPITFKCQGGKPFADIEVAIYY